MDIIEKFGSDSLIQHGRFNDRIYLMKLSRMDYPEIISMLEAKAKGSNYSKISAKVPVWGYEGFMSMGFIKEAMIPRFGKDQTDLFFLSKFYNKDRSFDSKDEICNDVLDTALSKNAHERVIRLGPQFSYRKLDEDSIIDIVDIYKTVFATYPFPIHDEKYIKKTMNDNLIYFGIFDKDKLIAVSSTEIDIASRSVEMTDFSTLPEYRGKGFSAFLLGNMEKEMERLEIQTSYTIARAVSYGMNIAFSRKGYIYGGRLVNNTNISGSIESMNIWYKHLK